MIGHGMPVYTGYASQYGHGFGNILGGIVRSAIPFIKPIVKSAGRKLLKAGVNKIEQKFIDDNRNARKRKINHHTPIRHKVKKRKVTNNNRNVKKKTSNGTRHGTRDIFS